MNDRPDKPRCARCGHIVTLVHETTDLFAVWCACAAVSSADPHYRGVGRGATEAEAIEAWKNSAPLCGKTPG